jgi:hypothetical protein
MGRSARRFIGENLAQAQQAALLEAGDVHLGNIEFTGDFGL